jgi:hypothetical protein
MYKLHGLASGGSRAWASSHTRHHHLYCHDHHHGVTGCMDPAGQKLGDLGAMQYVPVLGGKGLGLAGRCIRYLVQITDR